MTDNPNKFSFNIEDHPAALPPDTVNIPKSQAPPAFTSQEQVSKIRRQMRIVKWCTLPLILIQLLFILPEAYPLLVTMLFPILGLVAAIRLSEYLVKLFGIYLILLIFIQVINMIILQGTAYVVVQCLFILFELFVAIVSIRASLIMKRLTQDEWTSLRMNS
jgi:hypothetical protein